MATLHGASAPSVPLLSFLPSFLRLHAVPCPPAVLAQPFRPFTAWCRFSPVCAPPVPLPRRHRPRRRGRRASASLIVGIDQGGGVSPRRPTSVRRRRQRGNHEFRLVDSTPERRPETDKNDFSLSNGGGKYDTQFADDESLRRRGVVFLAASQLVEGCNRYQDARSGIIYVIEC